MHSNSRPSSRRFCLSLSTLAFSFWCLVLRKLTGWLLLALNTREMPGTCSWSYRCAVRTGFHRAVCTTRHQSVRTSRTWRTFAVCQCCPTRKCSAFTRTPTSPKTTRKHIRSVRACLVFSPPYCTVVITGAALLENNEASTKLTTANGGTFASSSADSQTKSTDLGRDS